MLTNHCRVSLTPQGHMPIQIYHSAVYWGPMTLSSNQEMGHKFYCFSQIPQTYGSLLWPLQHSPCKVGHRPFLGDSLIRWLSWLPLNPPSIRNPFLFQGFEKLSFTFQDILTLSTKRLDFWLSKSRRNLFFPLVFAEASFFWAKNTKRLIIWMWKKRQGGNQMPQGVERIIG